MAASVLDLNTLVDREAVTIDGIRYEMRSDAELSLFQLSALERASERVHAFAESRELTADQHAEYEQLLERAAQVILMAPPEVLARLKTGQREALLWAFIALSRPGLVPTRARETEPPTRATAPRKTPSPSARGSRGSTGARRKRG